MADEKSNPQSMEKQAATAPEGAEHTRQGRMFVPSADIYETDGAVVVEADLPDVSPEDLEVTLENDVLTLHGRVGDQAPEGFQLAYAEYDTGDYHRSFAISNQIDAEKIEATMDNGVLRLTLPKVQPAHKKIEVN